MELKSPSMRLGERCAWLVQAQLSRDEYVRCYELAAKRLGLDPDLHRANACKFYDDDMRMKAERHFAPQISLRKKRGFTA